MIKYNLNNINDWNFGEDNIIKVYRNNAVCYYKVTSGDTPTPVQEPCFAVVDDISQYSETEFEDVFNLADEKWYKLNNLNQYEQYGIYGSGRTITTYEGKLTVDTETQPSRLPQGYTEVEYIEDSGSQYIDTRVYLDTSNFEVGCEVINNHCFWGYCHQDIVNGTWLGIESTTSQQTAFYGKFNTSDINNISSYLSSVENTIVYTQSGVTVNGSVLSKSLTMGSDNIANKSLVFFGRYDFKINNIEWQTNSKFKSFYVKNNGTLVRDFVPAKRDSDDKYGMYDIVNDVFYVSPNNVDFSGGEPVIQPTKTYEYIYSGGSWVNVGEVSGSTASLPNVSFVLNYNAKDYNSTTHSIPQTSGQTKEIDAIQNYGSNTIVDHSADGYISVTGNTRLAISGGTTPMYRTNTQTGCTMTIVSKVRTVNVNQSYSILTCRGGTGGNQMNWMWRYPTNGIFLHGSSSYNSVTYYTTTSASPITASVRVSWDGSVKQQINDWTNNGSYSGAFQYGSYSSTVNSNGSLFCDYLTNNGEFWKGDFYWVYMSQEVLTDEQVQQVIAYNEGGGGQTEYPLEYVVREDPPDNLVFSTMAEAEAYECPWVGMEATIDGSGYTFSGDSQSGYEWVYTPIDYSTHYLTLVAQTDNVTFAYSTATSSNKLNYSLDGGSTWSELGNNQSTTSINSGDKIMFRASGLTVNTERGVGKIIPSASASVEGNIMSLAYGDNFSGQTVVPNNYQFRKLFRGVTTITSAENMVLPATTVKQQCYSQMFEGCTNLVTTPKVIGSSAMTWSGNYCFSNLFSQCTSLTTVPSGLLPALNLGTQCYWYMFEGCSGLTESPILSAPNLVSECYRGMFKNCSSLNSVTCLSTGTMSFNEWFYGVAPNGTFYKNQSANWSSGNYGIPNTWTVVDYSS